MTSFVAAWLDRLLNQKHFGLSMPCFDTIPDTDFMETGCVAPQRRLPSTRNIWACVKIPAGCRQLFCIDHVILFERNAVVK